MPNETLPPAAGACPAASLTDEVLSDETLPDEALPDASLTDEALSGVSGGDLYTEMRRTARKKLDSEAEKLRYGIQHQCCPDCRVPLDNFVCPVCHISIDEFSSRYFSMQKTYQNFKPL